MTTPLAIRAVFWLWLIGALVVGRLSVLPRLPAPAIQVILVALTASLVLAYRVIVPFRAWVDALDLRALVLFHTTRFVGFYFLILYHRGGLPYEFAVPGGIGDIIVAELAIVVVILPLGVSARQRAISIWNVVGLIDILLVVFTAARLGRTGALTALTQLPLSLLPTFLVPLIIASHLAILGRFLRVGQLDPS